MTARLKNAGRKREIRPERIFAAGFLALILLGTGLLALPCATVKGESLGFFDSLFTATSAVCVTGLVAVDTGTTFSAFGQGALLGLIQVGGLGFMVFATLIMGLLGKRISLRGRILIRDSMSGNSMAGLVRMTLVYTGIAFAVEMGGALLLSFRLIPMYGWGKGIWYSVFHAISAFCNAGFDLFGNYSSLTGFANDGYVLMVVSLLIILGGIGFFVIFEVVRERARWSKLSLHTRIVLIVNAVLLLGGMLFFALSEWNNPKTLAMDESGTGTRLLGSFFQSVTMRTAGFNSVDLGSMNSASKLFASLLMFIGASPASTGGGVKTTTVTAVLLIVLSVVRGQNEITVMKKKLPSDLVRRAFSIVFIALSMTLTCTLLLTWLEHDGVPFIDLLFESSSAVATVGVSAVGSPNLHPASRAVLIPFMYLGRVGPMTLAYAFARKLNAAANRVHYPEDNITIG